MPTRPLTPLLAKRRESHPSVSQPVDHPNPANSMPAAYPRQNGGTKKAIKLNLTCIVFGVLFVGFPLCIPPPYHSVFLVNDQEEESSTIRNPPPKHLQATSKHKRVNHVSGARVIMLTDKGKYVSGSDVKPTDRPVSLW